MKNSSMIQALVLIFGLASVAPVMADGFICSAPSENLDIRVFNRTRREEGTRNAAVLVISDPSLPRGKRTLARFEADKGELRNQGTVFLATLNPQPQSVSQLVLGLRLAQIQDVVLRIDFSYREPIRHGEITSGVLEFYNINGDQLWVDLDCERYLKGATK